MVRTGEHALNKKVSGVIALIDKGSKNPIVQTLAVKIVERSIFGGERGYFTELRELHDWARNNIEYVQEKPGRDHFQKATETLRRTKADCEDYTILLGAMASHLGYPYRVRTASPDKHRWLHIYLIGGYPPGRPRYWTPMDASATTKPIGWENRRSYHYWKDFVPIQRTFPL